MADDDLRFGDISGSGSGSGADNIVDRMINLFVTGFMGLIFLYVLLKTVEILLNVNIPLV